MNVSKFELFLFLCIPPCMVFYLLVLIVRLLYTDFIVDVGAEIPDEDGVRREYRRRLLPQEDQEEDLEELTRSIQQRYARSAHVDYDEDATDVEQQSLLPSVRDPKLWMVKCAVWFWHPALMLNILSFYL